MPLWIPEHFPIEGETEPWKGTFSISVEKAVTSGLSFRPLADTIIDIYQWEKEREVKEQKAGISQERELELLQSWFQKVKKKTM
jgi:2'-hydroxyisoflavone reductase